MPVTCHSLPAPERALVACSSSTIPIRLRKGRLPTTTFGQSAADFLYRSAAANTCTMAFPNQTAAEIAQMSAVITLPSLTGSPAHLEPQIHRPYPSRIFSCDTDYLDINHSRVATRVLRALRGPKGGPRASYELLRQDAFEERNLSTRYLLRFDYGFRPPCTPWLQCLYIPVEHANGKKKARVWAVFHPEDTSVQCSYCDEHCQRGYSSSCPFAKVIGGQRDE
jgi:hypothetical protein